MNLIEKLKELETNNPEYTSLRYFDCEGRPEDCSVFLVGINPSKGLTKGKDFWDYWKEENGFDLHAWLHDYRNENLVELKRGLKPTRIRIEALRKALNDYNIKMLNSNIYSVATKRAADLKPNEKNIEVFELLLKELRPGVLVVHGDRPNKVVNTLSGGNGAKRANWEVYEVELFGSRVKVLTIPHLFNMALTKEKNQVRNIGKIVELVINGLNE